MSFSDLQKGIGAAAERKAADEIIGRMQDLHSSLFNNALNYTNGIILAGYAGIFATWTMTADKINPRLSGVIGILLVISIATFVSFEIYKMVRMMRPQVDFVNSVQRLNTPDNIKVSLDRLSLEEKALGQSIMRIWLPCFILTVLTGYGSGLVLLWSLIEMVIQKV